MPLRGSRKYKVVTNSEAGAQCGTSAVPDEETHGERRMICVACWTARVGCWGARPLSSVCSESRQRQDVTWCGRTREANDRPWKPGAEAQSSSAYGNARWCSYVTTWSWQLPTVQTLGRLAGSPQISSAYSFLARIICLLSQERLFFAETLESCSHEYLTSQCSWIASF